MRYANECGVTRYVNEQGLRTQLMIPQSLLKAHMGFGSVITSPLSGSGRKFLRSSPKPHRLTSGRQRDFISESCFWIRQRGASQQSGGGIKSWLYCCYLQSLVWRWENYPAPRQFLASGLESWFPPAISCVTLASYLTRWRGIVINVSKVLLLFPFICLDSALV